MIPRLGVEPLTVVASCKTQRDVQIHWDHNKDFKTSSGQRTCRRELSMAGHKGLICVRYGKGGRFRTQLDIYKGRAKA